MANIDLGNLTRYDGKIKEYTEDKYLSKNTANWQMTEKAGAVTCYPVPDTELEPIVDFSFKEIPPANGDKSPSNPSTITGMSEVKVARCGKNLLKGTIFSTTKNGVTCTNNEDGSYTLNGTASADTNFIFPDRLTLKSGIYILSGCPSGGTLETYYIGATGLKYDMGNGYIINTSTEISLYIWIQIKSGYNCQNLVFKPQVEIGSIATSFELCQNNDYIYQLGNTYYGGSVNLATGEMIITQHGEQLTSVYSTSENTNTILATIKTLKNHTEEYSEENLLCNMFNYIGSSNDIEHIRFQGGNVAVLLYINKSRLTYSGNWNTTINNWLSENNVFIVYKLLTPYIVQLDPIQIKSLTALDKNTPRLNTLYTDTDSIQVGYQKHPARTAYELENAILALGGGE